MGFGVDIIMYIGKGRWGAWHETVGTRLQFRVSELKPRASFVHIRKASKGYNDYR